MKEGEGLEKRLKIVVGENHQDLAMTMQLLIDAEPDMACIATAPTCAEIAALADLHRPDGFVLDLSLDDGSSIPLIRKLRDQLPDAVILVFTGHDSAAITQACKSAGATAVFTKGERMDALVEALRYGEDA